MYTAGLSTLGDYFFVLFVINLPNVVCSTSTIALYAGYSKIFTVINCDDDYMILQND